MRRFYGKEKNICKSACRRSSSFCDRYDNHKGKLKIENGEMIEDKEAGEGIYLSDFSDEELMELCRAFENNSDVIIDYMMEKGKLKEMEKNEKG